MRSNRSSIKIKAVALVFIIGFLAACQSTASQVAPSAPGISAGIGVEITDDTCPNIVLNVGQQISWTNQDDHEHIVHHKPNQGSSQFDSGTLQPSDTFVFTFLQSGSYIYECSEDGSMLGTITVEQ
jgi:plastocyanin